MKKNTKKIISIAATTATLVGAVMPITANATPINKQTQAHENDNSLIGSKAIVNTTINSNTPSYDMVTITGVNKTTFNVKTQQGEDLVINKNDVNIVESGVTNPLIKLSDSFKVIHVTTGLYVRQKATTSSKIIGSVKEGTILNVIGKEGKWLEVNIEGQQGFVYGGFVNQHPIGNTTVEAVNHKIATKEYKDSLGKVKANNYKETMHRARTEAKINSTSYVMPDSVGVHATVRNSEKPLSPVVNSNIHKVANTTNPNKSESSVSSKSGTSHKNKEVVPVEKHTDAKPVVHHDTTPVVKPVVHHDTTPVVKPVIHHEVKPVIHHEVKPVPVIHHDTAPVVKPVIHHEVKPTTKPVVHHEVKPTTKPVVHHEVKPVVHPDVKPVIHPNVKPVIHPDVKPVIHHEVKPVPVVKPVVIHHDDKPVVIHHEVKPVVIHHEVKPTVKPVVIHHEVKPVVIHHEVKPTVKPVVVHHDVKPTPVVIHHEVKPTVKPVVVHHDVKPTPVVIHHEVKPTVKPVIHHEVKPVVIHHEVKPTVKPVIKPTVKPVIHHEVKPSVKPIIHHEVKPASKPVAKPVVIHHEVKPTPVIHHEVKPTPVIHHEVKPAVKPIIHHEVKPVVKPVIHHDVKPVIHHDVKPTVKPVIHHNYTPVIKPVIKPVIHHDIKPAATKLGTVNIKYINDGGQQVGKTITLTGKLGSNLDYNYNLPTDYVLNNLTDNGNVIQDLSNIKFEGDTQTIDINVFATTVNVNIVYKLGNKVISSSQIGLDIGSNINCIGLDQSIENKYKVDSVSFNGVNTGTTMNGITTAGPNNVVVELSPLTSNNDIGTITVVLKNSKGQVIDTRTIKGKIGSYTEAVQEPLPADYVLEQVWYESGSLNECVSKDGALGTMLGLSFTQANQTVTYIAKKVDCSVKYEVYSPDGKLIWSGDKVASLGSQGNVYAIPTKLLNNAHVSKWQWNGEWGNDAYAFGYFIAGRNVCKIYLAEGAEPSNVVPAQAPPKNNVKPELPKVGNAPVGGWNINDKEFHEQVANDFYNILNNYRGKLDKEAISGNKGYRVYYNDINSTAVKAAEWKANEMSKTGDFSHLTPEGLGTNQVIGFGSMTGENLLTCGYNTTGLTKADAQALAEDFYNSWMSSLIHRSELESSISTGMGLAFEYNAKSKIIYVAYETTGDLVQ